MTPADYAALTQAGAAVLALAVAVTIQVYLRIKEDISRVQERDRQTRASGTRQGKGRLERTR